jgi:hypothetical protein
VDELGWGPLPGPAVSLSPGGGWGSASGTEPRTS